MGAIRRRSQPEVGGAKVQSLTDLDLLMDRQDLSLNLVGTTAGTFHWSQAAKGRKIRRNWGKRTKERLIFLFSFVQTESLM